ncbi:MAG: carbohydrate ABC transporter permease [Chloroflexota bacterium]
MAKTLPIPAGQSFPQRRFWHILRRRLASLRTYLILTVLALFMLGPMVWIIGMAFKTKREFTSNPIGLPETLNPDNFLRLFQEENLLRFFINSLLITSVSVLIVLVTSTMAGYALARLSFRGQQFLFTLFLVGDTIPLFVVIVPLFLFVQSIGLSGSRWSLILPYAAMNMGIAVYMMRGFFRTIATDIEDAAQIDGCSTWQLIYYILLPLVRPGATVVAIITFISYWNEYFLVQVLAPSQDLFTLPAGIALLFMGRFGTNYPIWGAGILLTVLPTILLFAFAQDKIIEGYTFTSK